MGTCIVTTRKRRLERRGQERTDIEAHLLEILTCHCISLLLTTIAAEQFLQQRVDSNTLMPQVRTGKDATNLDCRMARAHYIQNTGDMSRPNMAMVPV